MFFQPSSSQSKNYLRGLISLLSVHTDFTHLVIIMHQEEEIKHFSDFGLSSARAVQ